MECLESDRRLFDLLNLNLPGPFNARDFEQGQEEDSRGRRGRVVECVYARHLLGEPESSVLRNRHWGLRRVMVLVRLWACILGKEGR